MTMKKKKQNVRQSRVAYKNKDEAPKQEKPGKPGGEPPRSERRHRRSASSIGRKPRGPISATVVMLGFFIVAFVLIVCLILNAVCNIDGSIKNASEHLGSYFGYWVCSGLVVLFGGACVLVPPVLVVLGITWKQGREKHVLPLKIVLGVLAVVFVGAILQVLSLTLQGDMNYGEWLNNDILYGAADVTWRHGGFLGGSLGFGLYYLMKPVLSFIILAILLAVDLLFLIASHPSAILEGIEDRARRAVGAKAAASREARHKKREEKNALKKREKQEKQNLRETEKREKETAKADKNAADAEAKSSTVLLNVETGEITPLPEEMQGGRPKDNGGKDVKTNEADLLREGEGNVREDAAVEDGFDKNEKAPTEYTAEATDDTENRVDGGIELEKADESGLDDAEKLFPRQDNKQNDEYGSDRVDDLVERVMSGEEETPTDPADTKSVQGETAEEDPVEPVIPEYVFPPLDLLKSGPATYTADEREIERNKALLRDILEHFNVRIREIDCSCGPTVTRYELKPEAGVRVRSILGLSDDIALGLSKAGIRIEAPIPGKPAVGIEVENDHRSTVFLRNLLESPEFAAQKGILGSALGADVSGRPVAFDIEKMPHLLIAGATGMGKSVCINSIIISLLYRAKPEDLKLIMIDPKKVEFTMYRDIPHLYAPIVSDPKKAAGALASAVNEMEHRFELIEQVGVRNIAGYNEITKNDPDMPYMPRMVIIIDELADLMMTAPKDVESAICRLAQKARAAGIHLIIGTQRPSVDVITGLIKANIPSRIACTVSSGTDSRTILNTVGAEKLCGRGDMLFSPVGQSELQRVQGAFVSDGEVESVVEFIISHNGKARYNEDFARQIEVEAAKCGKKNGEDGDMPAGGGEFNVANDDDNEDRKLQEAMDVAVDFGKISTSLLQRRLNVGYGRAAKLIDRMEELGVVGPADGNKPRQILITKQDLIEMRMKQSAPAESGEVE